MGWNTPWRKSRIVCRLKQEALVNGKTFLARFCDDRPGHDFDSFFLIWYSHRNKRTKVTTLDESFVCISLLFLKGQN